MSEEPDVNKMAAEFLTQNIEKFYSTGKDVIKGAADNVRLHLNRSYKDYLQCVLNRFSRTKSFFIRNEPTYLYNFYVPTSISTGERTIRNPSIASISSVNPLAVITGGGGSGKSMLMRHLLLDAVLQKDKVPIFLELRELNQEEPTLLAFIKETLHSNDFSLDDDYIEKALKAGHFALLFDGFDEIKFSARQNVRKQLFHLAKNYDQNTFILSSRPDNEFSGWSTFSVFQMDSLELRQAVDLAGRLPVESDIKAKFINDLQDGLFKKHESFLSNPLLLSIMLLTYGEYAEIPNKLSIFYSQAYETLFQRHDALKAGFTRERLTKLDLQDFGRVFAAFSIQTFDKRQFQMSESEALEYLDKAKKIVNVNYKSGDYLKDAVQAVCLLVDEGLMIAFSHRSFQEYFVAKFISEAKPEIKQRLIDRYSKNIQLDDVIDLLYEMRPEMVERIFVIPAINKLQEMIGVKRRVGITHLVRFFKAQYGSLALEKDKIVGRHKPNREWFAPIMFTLNHCGHIVGWKGFNHVNIQAETETLYRRFGEVKFNTSELSYKDEFLKGLAGGESFFSIKTLETVFSIRDELVKIHLIAEQSIDEILG